MAKIVLSDKENKELKKLMAQGLSKGEALVKMGKAVKVVQEIKDVTPVKKERKPRPVDPDKVAILDTLNKALEDFGIVIETKTNREIEFIYNNGNYTVTLVKHNKEKK